MQQYRGLGIGGYEMECDMITGYTGLEGKACGLKIGMVVEVFVVRIEYRKVKGNGKGRMI